MRLQLGHCRPVYALDRPVAAHPLQEVIHQEGQVLNMIRKSGRVDEEDCQPVVQVGAETSRLGVLSKRLVRGGNNPHVDLRGVVISDALQLPTLNETQQLGLQAQRYFSDLVKKQGSSVGGFDASDAPVHRACECAPRVAEEFGFDRAAMSPR